MAEWRLFACDGSGNRLANLTPVGRQRRFAFRLNRPAQLTFEAPSDSADILAATPGRVIKGYRKEGSTWVIRYTGNIWQISDEGEADRYTSRFVCFDALQRLSKRLVRDATNAVPADGKVTFSAVQVETIVRNMIDRTNTGGGVCGLRTNAAGPSLGTRTVDYEWQNVAAAMNELFEGSGLNAYVVPEDRVDGYLGYIVLQGAVSTTAAKKLVWGAATHTAAKAERLQDMTDFANDLRVMGAPAAGAGARPIAARTDPTSITDYGRYEDVMTFGDISVQGYIDNLADQAIALRKAPKVTARFSPQADPASSNPLNPFTDFLLGDQVEVYAGAKLRGGFSGTQRLWGFDLELDDNAVERMPSVYVGPDA
jgi:hypothetical protein